jgi:hypothetical protein
MAQTGHRSLLTLRRYIRDGTLLPRQRCGRHRAVESRGRGEGGPHVMSALWSLSCQERFLNGGTQLRATSRDGE